MNKIQELARFLLGKSGSIDFTNPAPSLVRSDNREFRKQILELTAQQSPVLGISKSTLHHLRKHARSERSFKVYEKVADRLARFRVSKRDN